MKEIVTQIAVFGEHHEHFVALTSEGRIFEQSSMYRNTKRTWHEVDSPLEKEEKKNNET